MGLFRRAKFRKGATFGGIRRDGKRIDRLQQKGFLMDAGHLVERLIRRNPESPGVSPLTSDTLRRFRLSARRRLSDLDRKKDRDDEGSGRRAKRGGTRWETRSNLVARNFESGRLLSKYPKKKMKINDDEFWQDFIYRML